MKKKTENKKICKQCKRKLPKSYFNDSEEAKKNHLGIEDFCGVCWSCP